VTTSAPLLDEPLPVELMNTIWADGNGVHDALETPQQTAEWLEAVADRLDIPVEEAELGSISTAQLRQTWIWARDLRDALRRLAADTTGDHRPGAASAVKDISRALTVLNKAAALAPRWSALELFTGDAPARLVRTGKSAQDAAISQCADEAVVLLSAAAGSGLRACQAPGCVLYFVKQHPRREWCSAACGNRARVARHYQRHNTAHA